ncbi:hypothetical protein [Actinoplanes sp. NPDC051411]|uniref:hypothetical protein n=1 Tax=Actinoplanes sp. NPDC051411 TaxID=3155522 RepID=UPI00342F9087
MMDVRLSTQAAPDRITNEDGVLAIGALVAVFDGVTQPSTVDSGCSHGPAWYVRRLAARLALAYADAPEDPLPDLLAHAIGDVADEHRATCDLTRPATPASTVCMLREGRDHIDYLVLCDSTLVLDCGERTTAVTDNRIHQVIARTRPETVAGSEATVKPVTVAKWRHTNQRDGYWIAAANPQAAHHSVTGRAPLSGPDRVRRAALLTDGAAAAVDQFRLFDWAGLLDALASSGPAKLIGRIRSAEAAAVLDDARLRYKRYDDATAAICLFEDTDRRLLRPHVRRDITGP